MMETDRRDLPDGWRWAKVTDLGPVADGDWILNSDYAPQGVRLLQVGDVGIGRFIGKSSRFIILERAKELNCTLLEPGDILISRMPDPIGRACAMPDIGYPCITAVDVSIWRPQIEEVDRVYLVHYLNSPDWFAAAASLASGATRQRISRLNLEKMEIPLPLLEEQRRIAAILGEQLAAMERARVAAEAQLGAAEMLPAAYLREMFESEEAEGWDRKSFGDVCDIVARQVDPKVPEYGALPHVNGENIESGTCRLLEMKTAAEDGMISGKYLFEPGDVLYSKLRPYLRKVTVVDFRGVCSADMYPIRVDRNRLDPHFTGWLLVSNEFTQYADEESRRARMPKLNRDQLFAWKAPIPPLDRQQHIAAMLKERMDLVERARQALQAQLDGINQLPGALLRRAFAGEV